MPLLQKSTFGKPVSLPHKERMICAVQVTVFQFLGLLFLYCFVTSYMSVCSLKIFVYDGKTGEKVCALGGGKAHDGGIYAVSITSFVQMICSISLPSSWTVKCCNNKCIYYLAVTFVFTD